MRARQTETSYAVDAAQLQNVIAVQQLDCPRLRDRGSTTASLQRYVDDALTTWVWVVTRTPPIPTSITVSSLIAMQGCLAQRELIQVR